MQVDPTPSKQQPADLEVLLQAQSSEDVGAKPKFLSKAERREIALKKREEQVSAMRQQQDQERQMRSQFFEQARAMPSTRSNEPRRDFRRGDRDDRDRENRRGDDRRGDRGDRGNDRNKYGENKDAKLPPTKQDPVDNERGREMERELIKKHYMGLKEKKKRFVKPSEKFKFNFEWDAGEDTSADLNPLYNHKFEARPALGRGYIGGVDKREQLSRYKDLIRDGKRDLLEQDDNVEKLKQADTQQAKYERQLHALDRREISDRHWSDKKLDDMAARDWRIFKEDFNITTKGGRIPNPIRNWSESALPEWLMTAIHDAKYDTPTPVQKQAIPIGLAGRDILGVAETGSGKTAAFVIPMLVYISKLPRLTKENAADGPYAVVMAPTRELASQIAEDAQRFASYNNYNVVLLVGGQCIQEQASLLRKGCEIVIATPGRLNDCLESHYIVLNQCNYVVLDEADRMIDMGFEPQILTVLNSMPRETLKSVKEEEAEEQEKDHRNKYRTTLMFSATMPAEVERLAAMYLRHPGIIYIGEVGRAAQRIRQEVLWTKNENEKKTRLEVLLREGPPPPIIIFVNQRKTCDSIAKYLSKLGYKCTTLQGGRSQDQREWALQEFKDGRSDILVATDVAGRGIDVKGVTHVINFDMPKTIEQYTHRIGRTARAGESGLATSFITADDAEVLYPLKKMLQESGNSVPPELAHHPDAQVKPGTAPQKSRKDTIIYTS